MITAQDHRTLNSWVEACAFRVYGQPKGQPRPRAFARRMGNKVVARMYDAGTAEGWKGCVALAAGPVLPRSPLTGPLRVDSTFLMPRPQSLSRRCDPDGRVPFAAKPDRDNLDKAVLDCLTQLGLWGDDAQVCCGEVSKWYAAKGERPGAIVRVMRWVALPAAGATRTRPTDSRVVSAVATRQTGSSGLW